MTGEGGCGPVSTAIPGAVGAAVVIAPVGLRRLPGHDAGGARHLHGRARHAGDARHVHGRRRRAGSHGSRSRACSKPNSRPDPPARASHQQRRRLGGNQRWNTLRRLIAYLDGTGPGTCGPATRERCRCRSGTSTGAAVCSGLGQQQNAGQTSNSRPAGSTRRHGVVNGLDVMSFGVGEL